MSWSGSNPNPSCPNYGRAAEQAAGRFYDVAASDTHAATIGCVAFYGVTLGAGDGTTYDQGRVVTRKQMAMFLSRVVERLGLRPDSRQLEAVDFSDIRSLSSAARHAVQVVGATEIMPGLSPTSFSPGAPVRRDNMAMFLANLLALATTSTRNPPITVFRVHELPDGSDSGWFLLRNDGTNIPVSTGIFSDLSGVGAAQRNAINAMWEIGVVAGKSGSRRFDPSGSVTRAQMASFIVRALGHTDLRPDGQITLAPLPPEPQGGEEENRSPDDSRQPPAPEVEEPDTEPGQGQARAGEDSDGSDPLQLIAHAPFARAYSLPAGQRDRFAVWLCNTPDGDQWFSENRDERHNPDNYADKFTSQVRTYFNWLSEGAYQPAFIPGGVITVFTRSGQTGYWGRCADVVLRRSHPDNTDGAIIVVDLGGSEQIAGLGTCGYYSQRNFPDNKRVVLVDSQAFLDPHVVAHEIGHSLCWPHSYSRETIERDGSYWEYDDPMDIMGIPASGDAASKAVPQVGTSAINRYAAGWIKPHQVAVHVHGIEARYKLHPIGSDGHQMLILPFAASDGGHYDYLALGVRVKGANGWWYGDRAIPKEGVEIYLIGQSRTYCTLPDRGSCHGLDRYHWPLIADYPWSPYSPTAPDHVMAVGDKELSFQQAGFTVSVAARDGNAFYVNVKHYSSADHQPYPPSTNFGYWERATGYEGYWLTSPGRTFARGGSMYLGCSDGDPTVVVDSRVFVSSDYTDDLLRIDYKADSSPDRKWAWWMEVDNDYSTIFRIRPRYSQEARSLAVYLRSNPGRFWLWWQNWHSGEWKSILWEDTSGISAVMSALSCFTD